MLSIRGFILKDSKIKGGDVDCSVISSLKGSSNILYDGTQRMVDVDNYTKMYIMVYMNTILNIKTDKALKDSAKELAAELGVPLSTAINAFLKQFVRDRELTVTASYKPSVYLRGVLAESDKEIRQGKVKGPFAGVENLVKSLNS